jgi:hypothetical protein
LIFLPISDNIIPKGFKVIMKGIILSVAVFLCYLFSVIIACQIKQFERHSKIFLPMFALWLPVYFIAYLFTPDNLYFLPAYLTVEYKWLDLVYGSFIYALNFHNQIDFFYTINGGFSTCILIEIKKTKDGLSDSQIVNMFRKPGESMNKIFSWRLPRLAETGYITFNEKTGLAGLTKKGLLIAVLVKMLKKILNVPKEGE